jgi:hypothetical protein
MSRAHFVSGGSGRVFREVQRHGKLHWVKMTVAVKAPSVFIPAPLDLNCYGTVGVHLNSLPKSLYVILSPASV